MAWAAYFRCFPSDFLNGLAGLSPEEQVVYFTVILKQYDLGGPVLLKHHDRDLRQRADLTPRKLRATLDLLVERGKLVEENGAVWNERAAEEISKTTEILEKNRQNAHRGGEANKIRLSRLHDTQNGKGKTNKISESREPTGQPNGYPTGYPKGEPKVEPKGEPTGELIQNPESRIGVPAVIEGNPPRVSVPAAAPPSASPDLAGSQRADLDAALALCAGALGQHAPADFVIGPMLPVLREFGNELVALILRSEADRPRKRPIRTWGVWANAVRERVDDYRRNPSSAPPQVSAATKVTADADGRSVRFPPPMGLVPWSQARGMLAKFDATGYWPVSLGEQPGRPGCPIADADVATMRREISGGLAA